MISQYLYHEHLYVSGSYYNYDSNPSSGHHDSVMSDQLSGHWFLRASNLADDTVSIHLLNTP